MTVAEPRQWKLTDVWPVTVQWISSAVPEGMVVVVLDGALVVVLLLAVGGGSAVAVELAGGVAAGLP